MIKNDFALHLANHGRKSDAIHEFKKNLLNVQDNAVLYKNYAAVLAKSGRYREALDAATRARHLNPSDPMNHRNIAKLQYVLGDTRTAVLHNMESIHLEGNSNFNGKLDSTAYRSAAVQVIAKGGDVNEAQSLMDAARKIEGAKVSVATTLRTNEIIYKVMKKKEDGLAQMEIMQREAEAKKAQEEAENDKRRDFILPDINTRLAMKNVEEDEEDDGKNKKNARRRRTKKKAAKDD
mmetsp:Transcript_8148/g.11449  ORF Transcript_8148/g.11449 Transcript_8148/m.11449 type:complete len:236 (+) Transcript_8148:311-1018(+)